MQITLHAGAHTDGSHLMAQHLQSVLQAALDRFGARVLRVDAYLSDENGPARAGPTDIHCTLHAHVAALEPVVVKEQAASAHQAIDGAARKLKRAVGTALGKHDLSSTRAAAAPAAEQLARQTSDYTAEGAPPPGWVADAPPQTRT